MIFTGTPFFGVSVFLVDSTIYTAFKKAPAYNASKRTLDAQKMYFPRAFCESPSTMIVAAQPCRDTDDKTFLHPYWFGDAASDAVSIFNTDLYTNKAFTTDQDVYAKYLAVGRYSAKADWARDFILKALSYKGADTVDSKKIKPYFLDRYDEIFNHKRKSDNGWCSEFASVTLHESKTGDGNTYPNASTVKGFARELSRNGASDPKTQLYVAADENTHFFPAVRDAQVNSESKYIFGGTKTNAAGEKVNLQFSCTALSESASDSVKPEIGDLIFFGHSKSCHTGIVINVNGSHIFTVEGNVSEKQIGIGTGTEHRVYHGRRKISANEANDGRMVGFGDTYACHMALKAKLDTSEA